ncbi:hypothetical protein [Marinicella litoralis]|uniref:Secreted protein n=1 Tax=Marinicella litoralis TaxID=644220 RepID=A0A4R6XW85_9GAMM|nr:hypothetical protein [Marinicella litoralis]TDR20748.1 hypothetical protein C8D91_1726 [Marinicella litoralis]
MKNFALCILMIGASAVHAAPIRFDFIFEDSGNGARAEGYVVFEENLLVNPTPADGGAGATTPEGVPDGSYQIPGPAVLDLEFTVTGSQTSNGVYGLADYEEIILFTNGGTLNFNGELVGQPTDDDPWGTVQGGSAGDFNLFANDVIGPPQSNNYSDAVQGGSVVPSGCFFFELCTPGDNMILVSMRGTPSVVPAVPATSNLSVLLLLLSSMLVGFWYFRKS